MNRMPSDESKRLALLAEIERQGGIHPQDDARTPVVTLEQFFDGNRDLGSIGCNLWFHPGVETFRDTLLSIRARDDVQDVLVAISDVEPETEGMWPFSDTLYIISSVARRQVVKWLRRLKPDEVGAVPPGMAVPARLPSPEPGQQIYLAWWD